MLDAGWHKNREAWVYFVDNIPHLDDSRTFSNDEGLIHSAMIVQAAALAWLMICGCVAYVVAALFVCIFKVNHYNYYRIVSGGSGWVSFAGTNEWLASRSSGRHGMSILSRQETHLRARLIKTYFFDLDKYKLFKYVIV